jgi:anti-sigma B factor antagonist
MHVDVDSARAAEGFLKVTPHGSIDAQTAAAFDESVQPLLGEKTLVILLDFSHVEYVSSAGLQVLFRLKKDLVARGGDLLFAHLKPQIAKLFQVVNALPKESVFATIEEADRYFYAIMNKEIRRRKEEG